MSYTPKAWANGDVINATDLNKIEQGLANAGSDLMCNLIYNTSLNKYALDKTVSEIYEAFSSGKHVYVKYQYGTLGASGTGDYTSGMYVTPVLKIYSYNYDNNIRICISRPQRYSEINSFSNVFTPAYIIFEASSMDSYPTYYTSVYTAKNYTAVNGGVD